MPSLQMALPEVQSHRPGMTTLISLAIGVAFVYSLVALVLPGQMGFFWELVTLIDIMLLGHWTESRVCLLTLQQFYPTTESALVRSPAPRLTGPGARRRTFPTWAPQQTLIH